MYKVDRQKFMDLLYSDGCDDDTVERIMDMFDESTAINSYSEV